MSIVKLLEKQEADPKLKSIYDQAEAHFGHVPNLVKSLANNATLCTSITNFLLQSLNEGRISWKFKELMIIKTLQEMKSQYSLSAHMELAKSLGETSSRIGNLDGRSWERSENYTEGEKAVFRLIEQIAVDPNAVDDSIWTALKANWDNGQLLEIVSVITTFLAIGRIGDSLRVQDDVLFTRSVA